MDHVVLFVDDEEMVLESINRTLHREVYDVEIALGPHEGLKKIQQCLPSVIITDMRMPEMDGIGFLQEARKLRPDAVYLVLSAYSDIEKIMAAINDQHVWSYISKPWQNEELKLAINNAIEIFEHREIKKELLASLERKNLQLKELNTLLEDKVRERTLQLQEKNEILQMLVEDAPVEEVMRKVCRAIAQHFSASPVFIDVPFLSTNFCDIDEQMPLEYKQIGLDAQQKRTEVVDSSCIAIPLIKSELVLGVVLIGHPEKINVFQLTDTTGSFLTAASLCLMQAKNIRESPELTDKIDELLGSL